MRGGGNGVSTLSGGGGAGAGVRRLRGEVKRSTVPPGAGPWLPSGLEGAGLASGAAVLFLIVPRVALFAKRSTGK
jgi:hypothetical protein